MNVSLTPELELMVNNKVLCGLYSSPSEVVREALRLMEEQDETRRIRLEELRRDVRIGIDQIERGEFTTYASPAELAADIKMQGRGKLAVQEAPA